MDKKKDGVKFKYYRLKEVVVDNKGIKLCVISLLCMFLAPIAIFLIAGNFMSGDISGATADAYGVMIPLDFAFYIAAWVLAILSRVKYKNRFSLVLIIIYGSLLALSVIGIIVLFCVFIGLL